jgi:hypothetical protein
LPTSSPTSPLLGAQLPRVEAVPPAVRSLGPQAVELAELAGLILDEWQCHVLAGALGIREDGKWSAFEVGLIVSRQNGKGSILEALELAHLFLFGSRLILHSAHEFKTAQEAFRRVLFLIENAPDLDKLVKKVSQSHGDEGIELLSGARLRFVARSRGSGRGFTGDLVIFDEAFNLGPEAVGALLPTLSAVPNPQVWYTSSAPMATSEQLHAVRDRGRAADTGRLAYFEWSAADTARDLDLDDRAGWAAANPALGLRITDEFIEAERDAMSGTPDTFARERLGVADIPGGEVVIPPEKWAGCLDPDPAATVVGRPVFAVDVSPDRSMTSIGVAGLNADGLPHVEVVDRRPGTGWVVAELVGLSQRNRKPLIVGDPSGPVGSLLAPAASAGVEICPVSAREHAQACGLFYDDVVGGVLRHRDEPVLSEAIAGATRRPMADAWLWDRRSSAVDITPLVVVTLARWALSLPDPAAPSMYAEVDEDEYARILADIERDEADALAVLDDL